MRITAHNMGDMIGTFGRVSGGEIYDRGEIIGYIMPNVHINIALAKFGYKFDPGSGIIPVTSRTRIIYVKVTGEYGIGDLGSWRVLEKKKPVKVISPVNTERRFLRSSNKIDEASGSTFF